MCQILIGTSGYDYPEWAGPFYPEGLERQHFLSYYADRFPTVELNFTYYRMPNAAILSRILERAPKLIYSVKANDSLTHRVDPAVWKAKAAEYRAALEPLAKAERLGAVLLQFPFSFHYDAERRRYLDALLKELSGLPLAAEFRNAAWCNNRVFDALREREVALAALDLPDLKGLPPDLDLVTAPLAYLRFHGRNRETWWGSDSAARYDYLYSADELRAWAERAKAMIRKAHRLLVYFNNHRRGQAPKNAAQFQTLLFQADDLDRPAGLGSRAADGLSAKGMTAAEPFATEPFESEARAGEEAAGNGGE